MLQRSALASGPGKTALVRIRYVAFPSHHSVTYWRPGPAPLAALALFAAMVLVLCVPPVTLIRMLMRRQALITEQQRPMVQEAAVISAGCAWLFTAVVCLFARPDSRDSTALWASRTAVHVAALLLSWLAFRGGVALAVLLRHRRSSKHPTRSATGRGEMV
jgi:hypothetical protein